MKRSAETMENPASVDETSQILAQFVTLDGVATGPRLSLPRNITTAQLLSLLNEHILKNVCNWRKSRTYHATIVEESLPYSFFVNDEEIVESLSSLLQHQKFDSEDYLSVVYQPQAVFRVRMVTHCSDSLEGHTEAILAVSFSPDGKRLATASGDTTVRLWDTLTKTPYAECRGHTNWVLSLAWSPDGNHLASGSMDQTVRIWDPIKGTLKQTYSGHKGYVSAISWEPLHRNPNPNRFISSSKDTMARVWTIGQRISTLILSGHTKSITCVRWGGEGLIYTASQDTTIMVWTDEGKLVRVLKGHAHWVNTICLSTDYALRTGSYDHTGKTFNTPEEAQQRALERYNSLRGDREILVSGSDDCTAIIWHPSTQKQPVERLTGHGKLINLVNFSPDGLMFATASFDKNIKLWSRSGKHLGTLRGHVSEVYQLCFSSDSRLLVSGSKDSTLKLWDLGKRKLAMDLPGHADEVYSVDWSPDGQTVASGSKDRLLKMWRS